MRMIILILCFIFSSFFLNAKIYLISINTDYCHKFIKGMEKVGIKFCSKINQADYILTCGDINLNKLNNINIPILTTMVNFCNSNKNVKIILKRFPSIENQIKIINNITGRKNTFGILLSSKDKIKRLKAEKIKNLKIFYINHSYEIPYKVDQAVRSCDIVFLYPDKLLKNKLILEFIIKKIILSGKFYIAYSKKFLNLGAKFVIVPNYYKEGENFAMIIKNKNFKNKVLEPKFFKVKINNYNN